MQKYLKPAELKFVKIFLSIKYASTEFFNHYSILIRANIGCKCVCLLNVTVRITTLLFLTGILLPGTVF